MNEKCPVSCPVLASCDRREESLGVLRRVEAEKGLTTQIEATLRIAELQGDEAGLSAYQDQLNAETKRHNDAMNIIDFDLAENREYKEDVADACVAGPQEEKRMFGMGKAAVSCTSPDR